jgi:hypothetical protein
MAGAIGDAAARSFAVAFYRALGNHRSVGNAVAQAVATLAAKQLPGDLPVCRTRGGIDADQIFLPNSDPHIAQATERRPLLDISYTNDHGWLVRNLGSEPAVRGIVFESRDPDRFPDAPWERPVRIAALGNGEERALRWLAHKNVDRIGIVYDAADGIQYSTICHHDSCKDLPGNVFPRCLDRDIDRDWDISRKLTSIQEQSPDPFVSSRTPIAALTVRPSRTRR